MKNKKFFLYILFFILFSHFSASAQDISDSIYSYLKKNHFSPTTQNLCAAGTNHFPYNIVLNFPSKNTTEHNLLLVFYQEEFENNNTLITQLLNWAKECSFDFNVLFLFSYGEKQKIEKQGMIYGAQTYLENINTNQNYTAIIISLDCEENNIISNSNGITAPSWLIKNTYDIFLNSKITAKLPFYYLSQMYRFSFFNERILNQFYDYEIPAIKIEFAENKENEAIITDIIKQSIEKFSLAENKNWDQHFLMLRVLLGYINLSEEATIQIILVIIFIWLIFIFILIFVNIRQKHHAWQRVQKIWYIVPVTFILIFLSFLEGRFFYNLISPKFNDFQKIYFLLSLQIFIAFFNASVLYIFPLFFNNDFEARSIDFLIILCCFINQSVFILVDISLFPIFMFICLLSILAVTIKNNILHIIIFIFMILPFVPYLHDIVTYSNISELKTYILTKPTVSVAISFILYPIFIVYFRVLTHYRNIKHNKSSVILGTSISVMVILITVASISVIRTKQLSKTIENSSRKIIRTSREELIDFNYYDKDIFTDTIRTINVKIAGNPVQCDVSLIGENHNPILYTDNDYETIGPNSVYFKIPYLPPSNMNFTYGCQKESCTIRITAIFENAENDFTLVSKTVTLGESK